jgi:hypothetical protein
MWHCPSRLPSDSLRVGVLRREPLGQREESGAVLLSQARPQRSPQGQRRMRFNNSPQNNALLTDVAFATLRTTRQNAKR